MKKNKTKVYIHIDEKNIKWIIADVNDKIRNISCHDFSKDDLTELIKKELLKKEFQNTKNIDLIIPRKWITIKHATLPSKDEEEIKNMISFQAVKLVPYSLDEIVIDFQILEIDSKGLSKLKLFVIPKNVLNSYIKLIHSAGLTVEKVLPGQELSIKYLENSNFLTDKTEIILDFDRHSIDIFAKKNKMFVFSRTIPVGIKDLKDEKNNLLLKSSLAESIDFFKRDYSVKKIDRCLFLCNKDLYIKAEKHLKDLFTCQIEYLDLFSKASLDKFTPSEKFNYFSISSFLGALNYAKDVPINLLPEQYKKEIIKSNTKKQFIKTGILAAIAIVLFSILIFNELRFKNMFIRKIQNESSKDIDKVKKLEAMRKHLKIFDDYQNNKYVVLQILSELNKLIPENMFLKDINYKSGGLLLIKGTSPGPSEVFDLIPKMETVPLFKNVSTRYVRKTRHRGKDFTDFFIECKINNEI